MVKTCYEYAINYISSYPKSEKELAIKLYQKGFGFEDVEYTIKKLKHIGYLGDNKFTQSYINSELINKGKPSIVVKQKLLSKGVDGKLIDELLTQNSEDIIEGIYGKIKKEISAYKKKDIDGFDIIQKLMKKGYKLDDIKHVIQNK